MFFRTLKSLWIHEKPVNYCRFFRLNHLIFIQKISRIYIKSSCFIKNNEYKRARRFPSKTFWIKVYKGQSCLLNKSTIHQRIEVQNLNQLQALQITFLPLHFAIQNSLQFVEKLLPCLTSSKEFWNSLCAVQT